MVSSPPEVRCTERVLSSSSMTFSSASFAPCLRTSHTSLRSFGSNSKLFGTRPLMSCSSRPTEQTPEMRVPSSPPILSVTSPDSPLSFPFPPCAACTGSCHPQLPSTKARSEEHTSELQSRQYLVCRLLLEKKKIKTQHY